MNILGIFSGPYQRATGIMLGCSKYQTLIQFMFLGERKGNAERIRTPPERSLENIILHIGWDHQHQFPITYSE